MRFQNELASPAAAKGAYIYDQTYNSFWDAVLKEGGTGNDRAFEKGDPLQGAAVKLCHGEAAHAEAMLKEPPSTSSADMKEEKKCAEIEDETMPVEVEANRSTSPKSTAAEETVTELTATEGASASFDDNEQDEQDAYAQLSHHLYDAPSLPEPEGHESLNEGTTVEDPTPLSHHAEKETEVKLEYKAEERGRPEEHALVEQLVAAGKPEPEMISQLMAQMISDAVKKELESRLLKQQREEQQQDQEHQKQEQQEEEQVQQQEQEHQKQEKHEEEQEHLDQRLPEIDDVDLTLMDGTQLDAESLAKAQAKLLEQAKSLAKAQALIQAQAKALARLEQQQKLKASPSISPTRKPISSARTSPNHPKPIPVRAPSDELLMKSTPPRVPHATISKLELAPVREVSVMSQSGNSDTTEVTCNTSPKARVPFEILSVMDGDWLSHAKSEAQAKAQALIRTAQAEAAARAQARREASERALAEERALRTMEVESELKAKAMMDARFLDQTQATFQAEENARIKAKETAKAAAEEKLRRKAETDAATHNVLDAQRAQVKAEAEYKIRLKANADARWLAECRARRAEEARVRQEDLARAKAIEEEKAEEARKEAERQQKIQEMGAAQARAVAEYKLRLRAEAMEKARAAHEEQAARAKAAYEEQAEKARLEAERRQILQEMAAAQARANAEHKLRLKADADAKWLAECQARRFAEARAREQAIAEAKAEAKVLAKLTKAGEVPTTDSPPTNKGIFASSLFSGAQPKPAEKLVEPPKEFVPFGKSKGEEEEDRISLYLQVPGVVHVSEVKVELEDGVLYISRGIILNGVDVVQKYTRSFPFEEDLLDTHRISVALIPASATSEGVTVLKIELPKVRSTWMISMSLADPEVGEETQVDQFDAKKNDADGLKVEQAVSFDGPDDEAPSAQPIDQKRAGKATYCDKEDGAVGVNSSADETLEEESSVSSTVRSSFVIRDVQGFRVATVSLLPGLAVDHVSAMYGDDSVCVVGNGGSSPFFEQVLPMNSEEVEVRDLVGSYDPTSGLVIIRGPLKKPPSESKLKPRRIKVVKWEEIPDNLGLISLFHDDFSDSSSKGSSVGQHLTDHKKGKQSIKSIASKYLRLKPKKHKHGLP